MNILGWIKYFSPSERGEGIFFKTFQALLMSKAIYYMMIFELEMHRSGISTDLPYRFWIGMLCFVLTASDFFRFVILSQCMCMVVVKYNENIPSYRMWMCPRFWVSLIFITLFAIIPFICSFINFDFFKFSLNVK